MRFYTAEEVATILRMHGDVIRRKAKDGTIPASKIGKYWRFDKDEIERYINDRKTSNKQIGEGR